ncbi:MAG: peptide chain release factor H [Candidatus Melainabacteria bacterium HGW-Melainabacteria-1]|nr:MAG: peptide chain release factor H [Candidatus Melainabacteria bacterium HGW-Melainabacteria-1]
MSDRAHDSDETPIWLQLSAGQGPDECAWVVAQLLEFLSREAARQGLTLDLLEALPGQHRGTLKSALLGLNGPHAEVFASAWQGTIQWIGNSPYRPHHRRRNWFVGIDRFAPAPEHSWEPADFSFATTRSGGPGGQNVNKVETAVRVSHLPSGLSVLADQERSQWRNRQLGLARLIAQLAERDQQARDLARRQRHLAHSRFERGKAGWVFKGPEFKLQGLSDA